MYLYLYYRLCIWKIQCGKSLLVGRSVCWWMYREIDPQMPFASCISYWHSQHFAASLESSTVYSILSQYRRRHDHSHNHLKMFKSSSIIRTFWNHHEKQTVSFEVHLCLDPCIRIFIIIFIIKALPVSSSIAIKSVSVTAGSQTMIDSIQPGHSMSLVHHHRHQLNSSGSYEYEYH